MQFPYGHLEHRRSSHLKSAIVGGMIRGRPDTRSVRPSSGPNQHDNNRLRHRLTMTSRLPEGPRTELGGIGTYRQPKWYRHNRLSSVDVLERDTGVPAGALPNRGYPESCVRPSSGLNQHDKNRLRHCLTMIGRLPDEPRPTSEKPAPFAKPRPARHKYVNDKRADRHKTTYLVRGSASDAPQVRSGRPSSGLNLHVNNRLRYRLTMISRRTDEARTESAVPGFLWSPEGEIFVVRRCRHLSV